MSKPVFVEFKLTERQVKLMISCLCGVIKYAPSYDDVCECIDVLSILRKRLSRTLIQKEFCDE